LLEFAFSFNVFLLELGDQIVLKFDLFKATVVSSISLRSFNTVLMLVFFKILDEVVKFLDFCLIACNFVLKLFQLVFKSLDSTNLLLALFFSCGYVLIQQISFSLFLLNFFSVFVNRFLFCFIRISDKLEVSFNMLLPRIIDIFPHPFFFQFSGLSDQILLFFMVKFFKFLNLFY